MEDKQTHNIQITYNGKTGIIVKPSPPKFEAYNYHDINWIPYNYNMMDWLGIRNSNGTWMFDRSIISIPDIPDKSHADRVLLIINGNLKNMMMFVNGLAFIPMRTLTTPIRIARSHATCFSLRVVG